MDILISSNLERLIYLCAEENGRDNHSKCIITGFFFILMADACCNRSMGINDIAALLIDAADSIKEEKMLETVSDILNLR